MNLAMENFELLLQRVDSLMRGIGLNEMSAELPTRQLMHHLLMARVMYETMTAEERAIVDIWQKKTKGVIDVNCKLKEKQERKKKKAFPPDPLSKENKKKEKQRTSLSLVGDAVSEVSKNLDARKDAFWNECLKYREEFDIKELTRFFIHWSEVSESKGLMRWELEDPWQTRNRIIMWMGRSYANENTAASIRLERTKGKNSQQEKDAQQQQIAAQVRRQQEEIERQKDEATKAGRMSIDEFIQKNPDSMMAKMYRDTHKNDNGGLRPK